MKPKIFFYVPVYNEQETIGVFLYRLSQVMKKLRLEYEIFLTLDGCEDDSAEVVAPYLRLLPVRVVHNEQRNGYGKCLFQAVKQVVGASDNPKRDFFLILDADFSCDPNFLLDMSSLIERNADLCSVDRLSRRNSNIPFFERILQLFCWLVLRFRGIDLSRNLDLLTTFRGCRVQLARLNLKRLEVLAQLGPKVPPAACGLTFVYALLGRARNFRQIQVSCRKPRRRRKQSALLALVKFLLLDKTLSEIKSRKEKSPPGPKRPRKRYSNKTLHDSSKV